MSRRKKICPDVVVRFYEGDEECLAILQQIALSRSYNDAIKETIRFYGVHHGRNIIDKIWQQNNEILSILRG